jgi:hypothetical protein
MLIIRHAQMQALDRASNAPFDEELATRLVRIAPYRFANSPRGSALAFATHCRGKAACHGFESGGDVSRFAAVALFLGADFDVDPGLTWARAILDDPSPLEPGRIDRLVQALDAWIDALAAAAPVGDAG